MTRGFVTFAVIALSVILALWAMFLLGTILAMPPVLLLLVGFFILQGLQNIPADPPHMGVETLYGERTGRFLKEGWRFFPFFPFVFGFIPVNVEKKNVDLDDPPQRIRTPDMAEVLMPVHYTYRPDNLITYLNSGGQSVVENILNNVIAQQLRVWGLDPSRKDWEDVVGAGYDSVRSLAKNISVLVGGPVLSDEEANDVVNGKELRLPSLGIILTRLNVGKIEPTGELAKAAGQAAKEKRDQKAEVIELDHIEERAQKLMRALGMTYSDAIALIQTERGKVEKTIDESRLSVSPEVKAMVEGALTVALARLIPGKDGDHD